jgi:hypothetical protein
MQIRFDAVVDAREVCVEPQNQWDAEASKEPIVAANDNGLHWPPIPFPEGWYASL